MEPLSGNSYDPPLGKVFGELAKAYANHFTERLKALPIQRYYYALVVIEAYGGNINQTMLGEELYLDKASVVRMLDYLETEDCIQRIQNPQDRRAHLLELTPKALAMLPAIKKALLETNTLCRKEVEALGVVKFETALEQIHQRLQTGNDRKYQIHFVPNNED